MEFLKELKELQKQASGLNRGKIDINVERKIRDNVFEIMEMLFTNATPEKFINTTKLMYRDWSQSYSEDIRFGRDEDADKGMIKLSTFEWVVSLPSVQKMRSEVSAG
ncbi:hypothetical protein M899_1035 [Bacteriovorax sp. BSW11_IV]|uniref:hypothetical protein n=1 Tax=Bacteriovorax sp. BSW11_IV TaxID=1353529 RepID=UPI00038A25A9|nr:hypothetical protein [Bacteriovorax sp. BSW11_IV]EQC48704.1 hypothetical protein M899_1035 [Bacteriovorax sp. BSW11_IV]